jgi:hypothetical protein
MKASIVTTLSVGFAAISFCGGFKVGNFGGGLRVVGPGPLEIIRNRALIPHANPVALSHRALRSTQLFVSMQETSLVDSSPSDSDKKVILLKQAENYLGSSSMVYLYAELRQLSYCGYTKTKFKEVDCNQKGQPISGYKLLDILLKEREWVIKRTLEPTAGEEWRSDRR